MNNTKEIIIMRWSRFHLNFGIVVLLASLAIYRNIFNEEFQERFQKPQQQQQQRINDGDDSDSSFEPLKRDDSTNMSALLLRAPFYVYEDEAFIWHTNATTVFEGRANHSRLPFPEWFHQHYLPHGISNPKHTDDYWFLQSALRHPMRTYNASEAKLFVVPTLINQVMGMTQNFCKRDPKDNNVTRCWEDLVEHADKTLKKSKWFKRKKGADHIVVMSHSNRKERLPGLYQGGRYKALRNCNILGYYEGSVESRSDPKSRLFFPKHYFTVPCPMEAAKSVDFAMIAKMPDITEKPNFKTRHTICSLMKNETNYTMPICGTGDQCPTLAQSRFGFHVRGDQMSSQRLHETMLSGTVPIFTLKEQYDHHPWWIDWDKLSYFADIEKEKSFLKTIKKIHRDEEGYHTKLANIRSNQDLFNWKTLVPFDMMMHVLAARVYPEEFTWPKNETPPYSALIL